jgi:hypothetical protein
MSLYGLASISHRALTTAEGRSLDRTSWTNQRIFDAAAIDFAREVYAREGRDALFVLPSYQIAVTLPVDARILVIDLSYEGDESKIADLFSGRVPGHVVVLMPNSISDTSKGRALLSAFTDYAPDAWERKTFANMSVFSFNRGHSVHSASSSVALARTLPKPGGEFRGHITGTDRSRTLTNRGREYVPSHARQ